VTRLLLVRHAAHDWLGRGIPGRMAGVSINDEGRLQAQALAQRLAGAAIDAIYSSPQQRTRETVAPLAARLALPVEIAAEFDEIDFGDWTGRQFSELEREDAALWHHWIEQRSTAQPPGGEAFGRVAQRAMAGLERLRQLHPDRTVLVLSHGDVIKAALASCLGMSLDQLERFDIDPASMSVLASAGDGWKVRLVNQVLTGPVLPP
jgi:broad specificity phosphatase PhoE